MPVWPLGYRHFKDSRQSENYHAVLGHSARKFDRSFILLCNSHCVLFLVFSDFSTF